MILILLAVTLGYGFQIVHICQVSELSLTSVEVHGRLMGEGVSWLLLCAVLFILFVSADGNGRWRRKCACIAIKSWGMERQCVLILSLNMVIKGGKELNLSPTDLRVN